MSWNPEQYLKFADHRLRPALDLLVRIPAQDPDSVVDLGCGPGNVTEWLKKRWPAAHICRPAISAARFDRPTENRRTPT